MRKGSNAWKLLAASLLLTVSACQGSPSTTPTTSTTPAKVTPSTPSTPSTPAGNEKRSTGEGLPQNTGPQVLDPSALPSHDTGFKPNPHGFAFANGSSDKYDPANPATEYLTLSSMQNMFGSEHVCTGNTSGTSCVPTPPAKKWLEKINTSMNGGQCEGMAVLALSLFKGVDKLDALEDGKANPFALSYSPKVRQLVGQYFAYQYTDKVQQGTIKGTPVEVLEKLKAYLTPNPKDPVTLGFYGKEGGHATTAYGLADKGNGLFHILMYDNNWPGQERYIEVNTQANTWIYNFAATNPSEKSNAWEGNAETQTLEFTPLSTRLSKASCPYCNEAESSEGSRQIFLSAGSSGNAHIKVVDKNDPSKFIGWDAASGKYVNKLGAGGLIYDKSILSNGDAPVAPAIKVPAGLNYEIKIDGQDLKAAEQVKVSVFGQGKSLEISNIDLDPSQQDTLSLGADGDSVRYKPGNSPDQESPRISVGYDDPKGKDYAFEVKNLQAGNGEELSADLSDGKLKVGDTGSAADPYDLVVNRFNDDGAEVDFSKDNISLGPNETDNIAFSDWGGQGQGMAIGPTGQESLEPDVDTDQGDD